MAFETKSNEVTLESCEQVGAGQAVVECKLRAEPSSEIAKVLSVTVKSHIYSIECMIGEARYSGRANFKVVYSTMTGITTSIEYTAEFTDKITDKRITPYVRAFSRCNTVDIDTISVSPSEIKLAAVVEIELYGVTSQEFKYIDSVSNGLVVKRDMLNLSKLNASVQQDFTLVNDIEIKDSVASVVSVNGVAYTESVEAFDGGMRVSGNLYLQICYLKAVDATVMQCMQVALPFTQEIENPEINKNCKAGAYIKVIDNKVTAVTSGSDTETVVSVESTINIDAFAYEMKGYDIITDAYSTTNKLNMNTESFTNMKYDLAKYSTEKIEGEITLDNTAPLADKIVSATGLNVQIANKYCENGDFVIEGVAYANVIYLSEQENTQSAIQVELPFSLKINAPEITNKHILSLDAGISEMNAKCKRGNLITVDADLKVNANFFVENTEAVLKEITESDLLPLNEYAIGVYLVRAGQTIWDVAKNAGTYPELIREQNPDLIEPLADGQRIVVYRQLN